MYGRFALHACLWQNDELHTNSLCKKILSGGVLLSVLVHPDNVTKSKEDLFKHVLATLYHYQFYNIERQQRLNVAICQLTCKEWCTTARQVLYIDVSLFNRKISKSWRNKVTRKLSFFQWSIKQSKARKDYGKNASVYQRYHAYEYGWSFLQLFTNQQRPIIQRLLIDGPHIPNLVIG